MWGCGGDSAVQSHSVGGVGGGKRRATHRTHTGTYTQMLHLPFSDLPLKKCSILGQASTFRSALIFGADVHGVSAWTFHDPKVS